MSARREKLKRQTTSVNRHLDIVNIANENKDENRTVIELGIFFIDLAKLVFGGVILTVLLDYRDYKMPLLFTGMLFIIVFVILGLLIIDKGRKK